MFHLCVCVGAPQLAGVKQEVQLEEAAGRMVNLSCEVRGHPRPIISWNILGSQVNFLHLKVKLFLRDASSELLPSCVSSELAGSGEQGW